MGFDIKTVLDLRTEEDAEDASVAGEAEKTEETMAGNDNR